MQCARCTRAAVDGPYCEVHAPAIRMPQKKKPDDDPESLGALGLTDDEGECCAVTGDW